MLNPYRLIPFSIGLLAGMVAMSVFLSARVAKAEELKITSPEQVLLTQVKSRPDKEALQLALTVYERTAPDAGREKRMVEALSLCGVMTSEQARAYRHSLDEAVQKKFSPEESESSTLEYSVRAALQKPASSPDKASSSVLYEGPAAVAGWIISQSEYDRVVHDDFFRQALIGTMVSF